MRAGLTPLTSVHATPTVPPGVNCYELFLATLDSCSLLCQRSGVSAPVASLDEEFAPYPGPTLTVEECAKLLNQDTVTIYRWLHRGLIPANQFGRTWVIYRDVLK